MTWKSALAAIGGGLMVFASAVPGSAADPESGTGEVFCRSPVRANIDRAGTAEGYRRFLGVWTGEWSRGRICSGLIVKKVGKNGDAYVDYLYRGTSQTSKNLHSEAIVGRIENNQALTFNDRDGSRFSFTLRPEKDMAANFVNVGGTRLETVFQQALRSNPPSATENKLPVPKTVSEIEAYCQNGGTSESSGEDSSYPGIENTAWRCANKDVLACYMGASGQACMKMDTSKNSHEGIRGFAAIVQMQTSSPWPRSAIRHRCGNAVGLSRRSPKPPPVIAHQR